MLHANLSCAYPVRRAKEIEAALRARLLDAYITRPHDASEKRENRNAASCRCATEKRRRQAAHRKVNFIRRRQTHLRALSFLSFESRVAQACYIEDSVYHIHR
jgi:hypothetical protein